MDKLLQRSNGKIDIELLDNDFSKFFQSGCCKILNPKNYNEFKELVLINTAGGITCNDNLDINANINNSKLSICTQAAEKIYAGIGDPARVEININLNNSTMYWLPKELILFDNSKLRRNININLSDNSNLIFCETTIFGRKAMSEKIKNISFSDQWKIYSNFSIKHFEAINIKGSTIDNFKNNFTFSNQSSLSTILIFGDIVHQLESVLRKVKKNLGNHFCEMTKFDDKLSLDV
jgi:Urease accessory protein UreH